MEPTQKIQKSSLFKVSPPIDYTEQKLLSGDHFLLPKYFYEYCEGVFITEGMIKSRLERMAYDIVHFYQDCPFTIVTLLKGSSRVFEELVSLLRNYVEIGCYDFDLRYDFVRAKSYVDTHSGKLTIEGLKQDIVFNKNILIVEDIIDTGRTLNAFIKLVL